MELHWIRAAFVALCCIAVTMPAVALAEDTAVQDQIDEVDARMEAAWHEVLARHDAGAAAAPGDAAIAVARCEFIGAFTDAESGRFVNGAPEAHSKCLDRLADTLSDAPIVRVYLLEQGRNNDITGEQADMLVADSHGWPAELRRRLATALYWIFDGEREGAMAVMAAQLGNTHLVPRAISHLVDAGDEAGALALLAGSRPADDDWPAGRRVEAALLLAERGTALAELRRHEESGRTVDAHIAARAYLDAGDLDGARGRLDAADSTDEAVRLARFDVAYAAGDWPTAANAVDLVRTEGFAQHVERFTKLVVAAPSTLMHRALLPSLFVVMAILATLALLPGVLLLPVHYRGALRRLRGRARTPLFGPVGLRHAWIALAAVLILPTVVIGVVSPADLVAMGTGDQEPSGRTLLLSGLWGSLLCMAVLALPLMRFSTAGGFGWTRLHRAWWRILLAWGALLAVGALVSVFHQAQGGDTATAQVRMVATLVNSGRTPWETALAFFVVALLGPLWEELAFRGMLLGGMARHISFGWANLLQAVLFALVHDDPPRFVFYLALGLLAGWLVRKTRSLAPAIALHALNNALAFLLTLQ